MNHDGNGVDIVHVSRVAHVFHVTNIVAVINVAHVIQSPLRQALVKESL